MNLCKNSVISQEMPAAALIQTSAIPTENFRKISQFQEAPRFVLSPLKEVCVRLLNSVFEVKPDTGIGT